ncbi:MAG: urease accessory protein UreF [Clostridia bacterium]|nr:urease accessory protein UreF [Clostridia bacterium]
MNNNFLLLQINDALFPIGGYSHSYGLETYIQKDVFKDEKDIREYISNRLKYGIANTELLGSKLSYERADNMSALAELDNILTASKMPKETRFASVKLGSRFIKTLEKCRLKLNKNYFDEYAALKYTNKHHCIAYGVVCRAADIDIKQALSTYLYSQCSAMITNCVKTVPLSQSAGQKMLYDSFELMKNIIDDVLIMDEGELCSSAPAFDIRCMEHEKLYSRLYMS